MDQAAQVREKTDIVSLIGEHIPLKKAGRNFKAVCPFHLEKTPSFVVSPERQIWHCFGCNRGGDCFTFLMEYEKLEFGEALRTLAKRAGIVLEAFRFESGAAAKKDRLYHLNQLATEYYHYVLLQHRAGKKALRYLTNTRGLNEKVIQTYMVGFAPQSSDALTKYLVQKKDFTTEEILSAGLAVQKGSTIADFFINRVIFPITDHRDNIVGFGGRIIDENKFSPKYINTKETIIYHKGDVLFGLSQSKNAIKNAGHALVMEGEFDVLSSFQAGITNAVAVKGTALTENQVQVLSRFVHHVFLCFDQDEAGKDAVKRSIPLLEKKGLSINVVLMPEGKDPDDAAKNQPLQFKKAIKDSPSAYDYLMFQAQQNVDKTTAEGKKQISDFLLPFFSSIQNEIVKEHYLRQLASVLETSYESVTAQLRKSQRREKPVSFVRKTQRPREEILEEYMLSLILQSDTPKELLDIISPSLQGYSFSIPAIGKIFQYLMSYFSIKKEFNSIEFLKDLPQELHSIFDRSYLLPITKSETQKEMEIEVEKIIVELRVLSIRSRIKSIGSRVKDKSEKEDSEELVNLQKELNRLSSLLS